VNRNHRIAYYTIGLALLVGGIFSALWATVLLGDLAFLDDEGKKASKDY
jgi:hypothetical protein